MSCICNAVSIIYINLHKIDMHTYHLQGGCKMKRKWISAALLSTILAGTVQAQTIKVDKRILPYQKVSGISGNASSIGSDTMNNMMALWLEA